jgi:hypothetical protein
MLPVSTAFQTAVKATVRRWRPKLQITWTDPLIDPTIEVSAIYENYTSYKEHTADLELSPKYKWFHLDGICKFDGTYHIAPGQIEKDRAQLGYWSSNRCASDGSFGGTRPQISTTFAARAINTLLVCGDDIYNEYPVHFTINIYNGDYELGWNLIYSVEVSDNNSVLWTKDILSAGITDATRMILDIYSWNTGNRVAKILEFYTSIVEDYEGDDIVSMNLLEEREIADGSLPVGNISANELDFELQNISLIKNGAAIIDPFSFENSASYLNNMLKKNRRIKASVGLRLPDASYEYVSLGTFWSGDWQSSEKSPVVSTSARDRMELLRKAEYYKSVVVENGTLYDVMETLLTSAKYDIPMHDLIWNIDAELEDFIIPYIYFPRQSYFKCIKQIVEACRGQAYMSRNDILMVTGPSFAGV